jgi:4-amino-4-deoxy-L-arabinose transferase-like glycosyltransferase
MDYLTLKISTALVGMLAIPAIYVLGRELGGTWLGLVSAALCAWSKWPTLGARRGLTFAWAVFPAALFLAAILRYMRRGDRPSALSAGLWLGLGQYGYNAFKIVPAMVPLAFGLCLFDRRWKGRRGRVVLDGLLVAATSLLVFLPLLQHMLQRPGDFWYRAMTRAGSHERPLPGPPAEVFAENLGRMAQAFHFRGDRAWINTVVEEPFLDPVTGAFFLAGIVLAGVLAVRSSRRWLLVLVSLFVLTLASTLSLAFPIENPGINRAAVALPSVLALAGLPAAWLLRRARDRRPGSLAAAGGVVAALGAVSLQQNYASYFVRFRNEQVRIIEPTLDLVRVMRDYRDARGVPFNNVYLLNTLHWMDGRCIDFEIRDRQWSRTHTIAPNAPVPQILDRPLLFFFHQSDAERREQLRRMFPDGDLRAVEQPFKDRTYFTYFVPR